MNLLKKILKYSLSFVVVAGLGLYVWFWAAPVGVNNYINKVTLQSLLQSPELMTSIGAIDNTPLERLELVWMIMVQRGWRARSYSAGKLWLGSLIT